MSSTPPPGPSQGPPEWRQPDQPPSAMPVSGAPPPGAPPWGPPDAGTPAMPVSGAPPPGAPPWGPPDAGIPAAPPPGPPPPGYGPPPGGHGPAWGPPPGGGYGPPPGAPRPVDTFAVLGFVFTFVCPGLVAGILCIVGLTRIKRSGDRGRGLAIAGLIINALLIVAIVVGGTVALMSRAERDASGRITEAGSIRPASLRTGDCLPVEPSGYATTVEVVPCSRAHWGQVVATFALREGAYPGDQQAQELAESGCVDRLSPQVIERIQDDELGLFYFHPQRAGWSSDRGVSCVVYAESGRLGEILPTS